MSTTCRARCYVGRMEVGFFYRGTTTLVEVGLISRAQCFPALIPLQPTQPRNGGAIATGAEGNMMLEGIFA